MLHRWLFEPRLILLLFQMCLHLTGFFSFFLLPQLSLGFRGIGQCHMSWGPVDLLAELTISRPIIILCRGDWYRLLIVPSDSVWLYVHPLFSKRISFSLTYSSHSSSHIPVSFFHGLESRKCQSAVSWPRTLCINLQLPYNKFPLFPFFQISSHGRGPLTANY